MARVTILRARFWPSLRASDSMSRTISAASRFAWFSMPATQLGLGLAGGEAGDPLQHGAALLVQPAELGPLPVELPLRLGQRPSARCSALRASSSIRCSRSASRALPALQVAAQLPDLFLDRRISFSTSRRAAADCSRCRLGPAHDRGGVGLGPRPGSGWPRRWRRPGRGPAVPCSAVPAPGCCAGSARAAAAQARRDWRRLRPRRRTTYDEDDESGDSGDEPIARTSSIPLLNVRPFRSRAPMLPPGRCTVMPCSEEPPWRGAIKPRDSRSWTAALAAIRRCRKVHAPGEVPYWLAGVLLASPSRSGPLGWLADGPRPDHPACDLAGRFARPVLTLSQAPDGCRFGQADSAFRCSLLIVLAYRDPACAEQIPRCREAKR